MSTTRIDEFSDVRRLLRHPKDQRPSPDFILSELFSAEQHMQNRQTNSGRVWTKRSATITTVVNTHSYIVAPPTGNDTIGKPYQVYRDMGNNVLVPVPHTDDLHELHNQSYDFRTVPMDAAERPSGLFGVQGEKVAFYRENGSLYARIYPVPETAGLVYTVLYAVGKKEWANFAWTDTPATPEYSRLKCLIAALTSLAGSEWDGRSDEWNRSFRDELRRDLKAQHDAHDFEFEAYIQNTQEEPADDVGYWWEN